MWIPAVAGPEWAALGSTLPGGQAGSWLEGISKTVKPAKDLACFFFFFLVSMHQQCKPWGYGACPQILTPPWVASEQLVGLGGLRVHPEEQRRLQPPTEAMVLHAGLWGLPCTSPASRPPPAAQGRPPVLRLQPSLL